MTQEKNQNVKLTKNDIANIRSFVKSQSLPIPSSPIACFEADAIKTARFILLLKNIHQEFKPSLF